MYATRRLHMSYFRLYKRQNAEFLNSGGSTCDFCRKQRQNIDTLKLLMQTKPLVSFVSDVLGAVASEMSNKSKGSRVDYRNTKPSDMDASGYDLNGALGSLERLKSSKNVSKRPDSRRYFTTRSNNMGVHAQESGGVTTREMRQNSVPTDRISRAAVIAGLMVNVASNTAVEALGRLVQGDRQGVLKESLSSDKNVKLLVDCLCKMRGTALKFGQLLSLQYGLLPETLRKALVHVRHSADVMPMEQVESILRLELGRNWHNNFKSFEFEPMASASLGQVHGAIYEDGRKLAVKIQFPGVLESIPSDIDNLRLLCKAFKMLPERFFVDQFANELLVELQSECNYENEAEFYKIFKRLQLDGFLVPDVIDQISTRRVITTEFVEGIPIENINHLPQEVRNSIGDRLLKLSLSELFLFGLMNTDPNPSNYLYNEETDTIGLIDFGSCRRFSDKFVKEYFLLVKASVRLDEASIIASSRKLGFLGPSDTSEMEHYHVQSVLITGEPFRSLGRFDFGDSRFLKQLRHNASVILQIRSQPPPPEVYSLHRKLAGCYVICQMIEAKVDAANIYNEIADAFESTKGSH